MQGLPELSLALLDSDELWTLIVGCSHSQVEEIVQESKKHLESNVAGVAGGFHLYPYSAEYLSSIATVMMEELQVKWVAPAHCTGENAHEIFRSQYNDNYKSFGLGSTVKFK